MQPRPQLCNAVRLSASMSIGQRRFGQQHKHSLGNSFLIFQRIHFSERAIYMSCTLPLSLLVAFGTAVRHRSADETKLRTAATSHVVATLCALQHVLALRTPHPICFRRHHAQQTKVMHRRTALSSLGLVVVVVRCRAALWAEARIASPARRSHLEIDHRDSVYDEARREKLLL